MLGILRFSLPDEEEAFLTAQKACDYKHTLTELDNFLRAKIKYEDVETMKVQDLRDKLHEILGQYDIEI